MVHFGRFICDNVIKLSAMEFREYNIIEQIIKFHQSRATFIPL